MGRKLPTNLFPFLWTKACAANAEMFRMTGRACADSPAIGAWCFLYGVEHSKVLFTMRGPIQRQPNPFWNV